MKTDTKITVSTLKASPLSPSNEKISPQAAKMPIPQIQSKSKTYSLNRKKTQDSYRDAEEVLIILKVNE